MQTGRSGMGIRKHRQVRFHKRIAVNGDSKRALLRSIAELRPTRVSVTEWFATVKEALHGYKDDRNL